MVNSSKIAGTFSITPSEGGQFALFFVSIQPDSIVFTAVYARFTSKVNRSGEESVDNAHLPLLKGAKEEFAYVASGKGSRPAPTRGLDFLTGI